MFGINYRSPEKLKNISLCPNIITPDTIPEFCIPTKLAMRQECKTVDKNEYSNEKTNTPEYTSHKARKETSGYKICNKHVIQVESVDDLCFSDEECTNSDPQSQAALSLPHLPKTQTSYGFCTLMESPHTRVKESLFHNSPESGSIPIVVPRGRSNTLSEVFQSSLSLSSPSRTLSPKSHNTKRRGTWDSDTTSSTESSPFSSPLFSRSPPKFSLFSTLSQENLFSRKVKKATASQTGSNDESSSTDNSPNTLRRASDTLWEPFPFFTGFTPPDMFPFHQMHHRERMIKENQLSLGQGGGRLRLCAEYCRDNQRLRVHVFSIEGLYTSFTETKNITCCVSLSLMPGKTMKQHSSEIKNSRNPVFNEDFFFGGISEEDLFFKSLRIKAVNKTFNMKTILAICEFTLEQILPL
ncbi:C2 calcium-dependent domain-containing protein 4A [Erpetoichthys calabaricus]|uniref:C2 calcium-dependent domain-containing protein 4A n=1 Tax=Erpetoichthys calabaricus TaxID=27687 RepID=UPI0022340234|nr:C2 calcium-dependent domain-containing protein 4A [Erpetoichthys calabaricus]